MSTKSVLSLSAIVPRIRPNIRGQRPEARGLGFPVVRLVILFCLAGPITLVLGNARYQRNAVVMACAEQLGITLLFLPSYSPNLNLIERLWKFIKRRSLDGNFRDAIEETLTQLATTYATDLASLMTLNFQRFENVSLMAARGITSYIDGRADLKSATKVVRQQVIRDLATFFGESRNVQTISPGDADDFKQWLIGRKLAATTIHKRIQVARSFFHAMQRRKLIGENPFDGVKAAAAGIQDRQRFVTRDEIALALDFCPNHHWRTIVALSRFGGLRCPSEVLSLRWQDIDWET